MLFLGKKKLIKKVLELQKKWLSLWCLNNGVEYEEMSNILPDEHLIRVSYSRKDLKSYIRILEKKILSQQQCGI